MKRLLIGTAFAVMMVASAHGEDVTISIENFTFNPKTITIKPGTTVTWVNNDDIPHSVVENGKAFHSPPLDTGQTYTMTFTAAGEVDYFCGFHSHMQGKVIVQP